MNTNVSYDFLLEFLKFYMNFIQFYNYWWVNLQDLASGKITQNYSQAPPNV